MAGRKTVVILAIGTTLAVSTQAFAVTMKELQGAWAIEGSDCANTFKKSGGKVTFKNPGSEVTSGVIVTGNKIVSPDLSCTAVSIKPEKDRLSAKLSCADTILIQSMSMSFKITGNDTFERFDPSYPTMAFSYRRCKM
ncbi:hypothetical protein [Pseudaminobacter soli (ex Li et al. 2025)]|uniref:Uncharacterized protein n=1 Tax=Pseudaminobacter soli (ex Li et al. 2025) TaxID=1295366 RepID=A0A2P7SDJ2_9HYPH|nr:hypothetical protein [Mesorhizobium soli]PSJ60381.1 hypothetical protein C7I85_14650 [Mesorhizobium soli]